MQSKLGKVQHTQYATNVGNFYTDKLLPLSMYNKNAAALINDAMEDLKNKGITAPSGSSDSDLSSEEWTAYLKELMPLVRQKDNLGYFTHLQNYFTKVQSAAVTNTGNILDDFDKYMTFCYNFDTLAYEDRELFRYSIMAELERAYYLLCAYMQYSNPGSSSQSVIRELDNQYAAAGNAFEKKTVVRRTDKKVTLHTVNDVTVTSYDDGWSWGDHRIQFTQAQAEDFISRLHGGTVYDELKKTELRGFLYSSLSSSGWFAFDGESEESLNGLVSKQIADKLVVPMNKTNPKPEWKETFYKKWGIFVKDTREEIDVIQLSTFY